MNWDECYHLTVTWWSGNKICTGLWTHKKCFLLKKPHKTLNEDVVFLIEILLYLPINVMLTASICFSDRVVRCGKYLSSNTILKGCVMFWSKNQFLAHNDTVTKTLLFAKICIVNFRHVYINRKYWININFKYIIIILKGRTYTLLLIPC